MKKYTEGPWEYVIEPGSSGSGGVKAPLYAVKNATSYVCSLFANGNEREPNGKLITGAPEMAEMLLSIFSHIPQERPTRVEMEALLKKVGVIE